MKRVKLNNDVQNQLQIDISDLTTGPFKVMRWTYRYKNGQLLQRVRVSLPGSPVKGARKYKFVWKRPALIQQIFIGPDFRYLEQVIKHFQEFSDLVGKKIDCGNRQAVC